MEEPPRVINSTAWAGRWASIARLAVYDHALCRAVLGVFARVVLGWYRRRARRAGVGQGESGAVRG